jgi:hypothetical protein
MVFFYVSCVRVVSCSIQPGQHLVAMEAECGLRLLEAPPDTHTPYTRHTGGGDAPAAGAAGGGAVEVAVAGGGGGGEGGGGGRAGAPLRALYEELCDDDDEHKVKNDTHTRRCTCTVPCRHAHAPTRLRQLTRPNALLPPLA